MKRAYDSPFQSLLGTDEFFTALKSELPPVFSRETASKCMGGILTPKAMSNADASGTGPAVRVRIGKKVGYERDSFIRWLKTKFRAS